MLLILSNDTLYASIGEKKHGKITNTIVSSAIIAIEKIYDYIIILRKKNQYTRLIIKKSIETKR